MTEEITVPKREFRLFDPKIDFDNKVFNFISSSWIKNLDVPIKTLTTEERRAHIVEVISELIKNATTLICCNADLHMQVYGWICYTPGLAMHFQYTKDAFRGLGVAKLLREKANMNAGRIVITHMPKNLYHINRCFKDDLSLAYDPYVLRKLSYIK